VARAASWNGLGSPRNDDRSLVSQGQRLANERSSSEAPEASRITPTQLARAGGAHRDVSVIDYRPAVIGRRGMRQHATACDSMRQHATALATACRRCDKRTARRGLSHCRVCVVACDEILRRLATTGLVSHRRSPLRGRVATAATQRRPSWPANELLNESLTTRRVCAKLTPLSPSQ
jgi:hypothetical protein